MTAVNFASAVSFQFATGTIGYPFGIIAFDGGFSVAGDKFSVFVDDSVSLPVVDPPNLTDFRYVWDVHGAVTNLAPAAVPEPGSLVLPGLTGAGVGVVSWRRRRATATAT
jgi:hypothetical protein